MSTDTITADPHPFSAPLCVECAPYAEAYLAANDEPCDDCWHKLPESVQNLWHRRDGRQSGWYSGWLNGEG